ncbi:MAG: hypothetical protein Pars2KO_01410 [Parasphingorhabdus sp.]
MRLGEGTLALKYRFDSYEFEGVHLELRSDGELIKVEPQVSALLEILLINHGRIVSKEEINKHVWGDRIVSDGSIDNRISAARSAIGDDGKSQRLIKTFPGRGFRFVGDVEVEGEEPSDGAAASAVPSSETEASSNKKFLWPALAGVLLLLLGAGYFLFTGFGGSADNGSAFTAPTHKASIAVLPFSDMSAAADQGYLGDGLAEELLHALARVEGLKVTSRTSAFSFRGKGQSISEIGKALDVGHVLEGSVRQAGGNIRITAQLIDTKTDSHIWSKTYNRPLADDNLFEVQDEIATAITTELLGTLAMPEAAASTHIASYEGYELLLRGRELMQKRTPESLRSAIDYFDQAIALDDSYAPVFAAKTYAYDLSDFYAGMPKAEVIRQMQINVDRGMAIAPSSPEVLTAAAMLEKKRSNYDKALIAFDRAIAAAPNNSFAIKGKADVLYRQGKFQQSLEAYQQALVYDPLEPAILGNIAALHLRKGNIADAINATETNLKWNKTAAQSLNMMSRLVLQQGETIEGYDLLYKAAQTNPDERYVQSDLSRFYADLGMDAEALSAARDPGTKASILALVGDDEVARRSIEQDKGHQIAAYVYYILGDYEAAYPIGKKDVQDYDLLGKNKIGISEILWTAEYAFILKQNDDPDAELLLNKLEKTVAGLSKETSELTDSLLGAAAIRIMRDDQKGALKKLDVAINRGQAFLTLTEQPIFAPLAKNPDFTSRQQRMEANAQKHREVIAERLAK